MKLGLSKKEIALRRAAIGGSDAGSIVAGGEAWRELWRIKTGRIEDTDLSDVLSVQMGSFTEPLNAYWYTKHTGREVAHRNERFVHPALPWLACNADGLTTTRDGAPSYIDFKHVGKAGDHLTIRYTAQCTHAAIVISAVNRLAKLPPIDWFCLSVFIGNARWELVECEVDPFFAEEYLGKCHQFWGYVERDEEPPEPAPLPVPAPPQLRKIILSEWFPTATHPPADWPNWAPELIEELAAVSRTQGAATANAIARGKVKELLPEDVGLVQRGGLWAKRDRRGVTMGGVEADG